MESGLSALLRPVTNGRAPTEKSPEDGIWPWQQPPAHGSRHVRQCERNTCAMRRAPPTVPSALHGRGGAAGTVGSGGTRIYENFFRGRRAGTKGRERVGAQRPAAYVSRNLRELGFGRCLFWSSSSDVLHPSPVTPARPCSSSSSPASQTLHRPRVLPSPDSSSLPRECPFVCPLHTPQTARLASQRHLALPPSPARARRPQDLMPSPSRERESPWPLQTPSQPLPSPSSPRKRQRRSLADHVDRRAMPRREQIADESQVGESCYHLTVVPFARARPMASSTLLTESWSGFQRKP